MRRTLRICRIIWTKLGNYPDNPLPSLPPFDSGGKSIFAIFSLCKGAYPPLFLRNRNSSVREPNAQPAPATGLFKGFEVLPQQAEKQTSGGNAGCLFRAFVGTNALLAK